MKKFATIALLLLASTAFTQPHSYQQDAVDEFLGKAKALPSRIKMYLPAEATVTFDGEPTSSTGTPRTFEVPPLTKPADYKVVVRIGSKVESMSVTVTPGEITVVYSTLRSFRFPALHPFDSLRQRRGEVASPDDDSIERQLPFLRELERYSSALNTQHTRRRWSGFIGPASRTVLEQKWQVPGHMEGVEGWSSALYRTQGLNPSVYLVRQDPNDGSSAVTWDRSYPDGAVFADVLRNANGETFEVRVAEKHGNQWQRYVAFKDVLARPFGYVAPKSGQCVECHNQAGRSEYDGPAVPGGDTIVSDPIPIVERGQIVQGGYGTQL